MKPSNTTRKKKKKKRKNTKTNENNNKISRYLKHALDVQGRQIAFRVMTVLNTKCLVLKGWCSDMEVFGGDADWYKYHIQ